MPLECRCIMPEFEAGSLVSIVVPFHNEELNVVELYGRLEAVLQECGCE